MIQVSPQDSTCAIPTGDTAWTYTEPFSLYTRAEKRLGLLWVKNNRTNWKTRRDVRSLKLTWENSDK